MNLRSNWLFFDVGCIAFFLSLILTPLVRRAAARIGLMDRPDNARKTHSRPVPRVGGIAVMMAYACALLFILVAPYRNLNVDIPQLMTRVSALFPAAALVFATGLLDDIIGLRPWQKLSAQTVAAVMAHFGGFGVYVLRGHPLEVWVSVPLTVFWLVGCSNALNLIDGMDGLAAGIGCFAAVTTLIAALTHQNIELALVTAPLVGALAGFLRYNFNPASIFLGDCGSLMVGFLLGCYGAVWSQKSVTLLGMTAPLMALAIPLLDASVAIVRRFLRHRPILSADRGHIHHRLLDQGLTPRRAALLLYALSGLAAVFSLVQDAAYNRFGGVIIVLFCAVAWIGVQHLGYAEFAIAGQFLFSGTLRVMIDAQVRLQQFEATLRAVPDLESAWIEIGNACQTFGFRGVRMQIGNRIFETGEMQNVDTSAWQLHIPLLKTQFIHFYHSGTGDANTVVLNGFASVVQQIIEERAAQDPDSAAADSAHRFDERAAEAGASCR